MCENKLVLVDSRAVTGTLQMGGQIACMATEGKIGGMVGVGCGG